MGGAPSNQEPGAGPGPLTRRRWRRSHPGRLDTGHRRQRQSSRGLDRPVAPPCPVLAPGLSERQRGRQGLSPRPSSSSSSVARLGRARFSSGDPPRWGEVSVTSLLGLRGPARAVVAARAPPGTRSPSGGRRPSELCVSSRRWWRRVPAPKGRHTGTPLPPGQPPSGAQLRLQRPLPLGSAPQTRLSLTPLRRRPVLLPGVRRFSWKRRCRG